jgi:uncharacterized protein with von Willebrand factor type A (vWA) domain
VTDPVPGHLDPVEPAIPGDPVPLDVAAVTAEFGAALYGAGVPADPGRCARFARAVSVMRPRTLRELHACGLATLVSGPEQIEVYDRIFAAAFGARWPEARPGNSLPPVTGTAPRPDGSPPDPAGGTVARPVKAARLDLRSGDGEPLSRMATCPGGPWPPRPNGFPAGTSPICPRPSCGCWRT